MVIIEVRKRFILKSTGPIRGFISLPCQKLYIILLVDPCIFKLAIEALPPFINNKIDKIIPRIQPMIENCILFCKIKSVILISLYIHVANIIIDKMPHKKPEKKENDNLILIIYF